MVQDWITELNWKKRNSHRIGAPQWEYVTTRRRSYQEQTFDPRNKEKLQVFVVVCRDEEKLNINRCSIRPKDKGPLPRPSSYYIKHHCLSCNSHSVYSRINASWNHIYFRLHTSPSSLPPLGFLSPLIYAIFPRFAWWNSCSVLRFSVPSILWRNCLNKTIPFFWAFGVGISGSSRRQLGSVCLLNWVFLCFFWGGSRGSGLGGF